MGKNLPLKLSIIVRLVFYWKRSSNSNWHSPFENKIQKKNYENPET